jgi:ketosteroid isomerase-like protein
MSGCVALLGLVLLAGGPAPYGQAAQTGAALQSPPDKARLAEVLAAWASMDVSRPAAFYAKDSSLVFYDVAPRKFNGWAEYEKATVDMFKTIKSLTFRLNDDAQVHHHGNLAWATATVDGDMANKDGSLLKIDARWTSVWEKRGNNWVIVHDHFSMPLAGVTPKPTTTPTANNP